MTFATPLLLIGLAAAAIPFLLHLISRVRAQEQPFPTLRFLKQGMERTARRRKLQNWLLLLLRSALLAILAVAVAEPISRATGGWLGGSDQAAVLLLDNSYSMAAGRDGVNRFTRAKADATALLSGEAKPALAVMMPTAGPITSAELTGQLDMLRKAIAASKISYTTAAIDQRFARAADILADQSNPRRALYIFGDLQRNSIEPLLSLAELKKAADMHLFFLDYSAGPVRNVGITDLRILGQTIVDAPVQFLATVRNSSPTARTVELVFRVDGPGEGTPQRLIKKLNPAGREGDSATVRFAHRFSRGGIVTGEVRLSNQDDLLVDNVRRFCLTVGGRARVLVVRGAGAGAESFTLDPAAMLALALDWRSPTQEQIPWPIRVTVIDAGEFTTGQLERADIVFFCEVSSFTAGAGRAIEQFVRGGGTAMFFLGPAVQVNNYNARFAARDGGLLGGRLGTPVGQVGSDADALAVNYVAIKHPLFRGLFDSPADYLGVLVQRYFPFEKPPPADEVLMRLSNGGPMLLERRLGRGRVLWCTTTASPRWTNLPTGGLFLPVVVRAAMQSSRRGGGEMYSAGMPVALRLGRESGQAEKIRVAFPDPSRRPNFRDLALDRDGRAQFAGTTELGVYRWSPLGGDDKAGGAFVVNPAGPESRLASYTPSQLKADLAKRGLERVYVGSSLAEVSAAAAMDSQGRNFWDVLIVLVILLLVAEALVANRRKAVTEK